LHATAYCVVGFYHCENVWYVSLSTSCVTLQEAADMLLSPSSGLSYYDRVSRMHKVNETEVNECSLKGDSEPTQHLFDCSLQVYPVMGFPDPSVVQAAQRLVSDHQGKFSQTSRILQQVF